VESQRTAKSFKSKPIQKSKPRQAQQYKNATGKIKLKNILSKL